MHMVRKRKLLPAVVALGLLLIPAAGQAAPAATRNVSIKSGAFSPTSVTIKTGDKITWKNTDSKSHQVVSDSGAFASPILGANRTYSFTFTKTGTFRYHDGLYPSHKAKIVVQARPTPPGVSLALSSPVVTFGQRIQLSGVVSSKKANETVSIYRRHFDETSPLLIATVLTTTGGAWSYNFYPDIQTAFQARFRNTSSGEVTILVRPHVRLVPSGKNLFAKVFSSNSFAGHYLILQRKSAKGTWVGVERLKLGQHSGRFFRVPRRHGRSVYRVYLTDKQAGPGYVASWSGTQTIRRR
jgi:plastocyanin